MTDVWDPRTRHKRHDSPSRARFTTPGTKPVIRHSLPRKGMAFGMPAAWQRIRRHTSSPAHARTVGSCAHAWNREAIAGTHDLAGSVTGGFADIFLGLEILCSRGGRRRSAAICRRVSACWHPSIARWYSSMSRRAGPWACPRAVPQHPVHDSRRCISAASHSRICAGGAALHGWTWTRCSGAPRVARRTRGGRPGKPELAGFPDCLDR